MPSNQTKTYRSESSNDTKKLGSDFAKELKKNAQDKNARGAAVVALIGDLGAGKTTFVQGFFKGLGLKKRAVSPTFIIMRRHRLTAGEFANVIHIDAYRLKEARDLEVLGIKDLLSDPKNILLVEWPERVKGLLPKRTAKIKFAYGKKENERTITYEKTSPHRR